MAAITVIARLTAKPGKLPDILAELPALVAVTRAEQGCLSYVPHVSPDQPDEMCFVEEWASRDAQEEHLATEHIKAFRDITAPLLVRRDVTVWEAHESA